MFLSKLFHPETKSSGQAPNKSVEHLAPSDYFTQARIDDLRATFDRLDIHVTSIAPFDS